MFAYGEHYESAGGVATSADYELIEQIKTYDRLKARTEAAQIRNMAEFGRRSIARVEAERAADENPPPVEQSYCDGFEQASAEIALALKIAGPTASARLSDALELDCRFPQLLDALSEGEITMTQVRILTEQTANLSAEHATAVVNRMLPRAASKTPSQFRTAVRKAVADIDPEALKRRAKVAKEDRGVWYRDLADGMAEIRMVGPADEAVGMYAVLDEDARQCRHDTPAKRFEEEWAADRDGRTQPNRRWDAAVDRICGPLGHPAEGSRAATSKRGSLWRRNVKVDVRVTVPFTTLLGIDEKPAHLTGYGAIDADTARELAADGTWRRILTDPATGNPVDFGTTKYRPPKALRDAIISKHPVCTRPGCGMPAVACDLDHHEPHHRSGGTTFAGTAPRCRRDHRMKQTPGWHVEHHPDGSGTWHTPSGHTYPYKPEPIAEPMEPPAILCEGDDPPF